MEYILNCSLGKDSVAALAMILKKDLPLDRIVFADVTPDAEFEETYAFKDKVERKLGIKIECVRSEKWSSWDDYFYSPLSKGRNMGKCRGFPPTIGPGCAYKRVFKETPLKKVNGKNNHIYVGIALDEAHRADAKMYKNAKNEYSFPLIDFNMTEQDCRELCEKYGILHPLYQYFRRLGCWQCPKQSLPSLRSLYQFWPEKWAKLEEYQQACAWDFRPHCRVEDLTKRFIGEGLIQFAPQINYRKEITNMAMSELKQRLLKIELARLGFPDAGYREVSGIMFVNPSDSRMPKIYDNGDIVYGSEYDPLVTNQIQPIVNQINEILAAWENAPAVPIEDISHFRLLSEYNNVVMAARDDSEQGFGYGFEFVTWKYTRDRKALEHGNYTTDYEVAKEDFAIRCGLIDRNKLFDETEMKLIRQGLVHLGANFPDLTLEQNTLLGRVVEKIEMLVPSIQGHEEMEHEQLVPDDGLEI